MTGQPDATNETDATTEMDESMSRTATIRTRLDDAAVVAASVRPDNTPEIDTRVVEDGDDGTGEIVTDVERETTGGLRTTVDDYVVNLAVAAEVVQAAKRHADTQSTTTHDQ